MYQNYNYYPQTQQQQPIFQNQSYRQASPQSVLKGRLVSSLEEARATSIDFDGSIFYFPDLANKQIYTKQINMDGTATLNIYELKEIPVQQNNNVVLPSFDNFVTKEEFEKALLELRQGLANPAGQAPQKQKVMSF